MPVQAVEGVPSDDEIAEYDFGTEDKNGDSGQSMKPDDDSSGENDRDDDMKSGGGGMHIQPWRLYTSQN